MTGTWINIGTILAGGALGMLFGVRLPKRVRETITAALGLFTIAIGVKMFLDALVVEGENVLIPLLSLLIGGVLGEWWQVERRLASLGESIEARVVRRRGSAEDSVRFVRGFLSASLLYCVGPMTILGALQDGLSGDYNLLAIKAVLDGFASLALASTFGVGVLFSTLVVFIYQGGISFAAGQLQAFFTPLMMAEVSAVGGVLLIGLAIGTLLELRPIRTGNLLPAILVAPPLVLLAARLL